MSSFLFGEIVEPTTRALVNEDIENHLPHTEIEWEGDSKVPKDVDTLIFLETENLNKIFDNSITSTKTQICRLKNGGIIIYDLENNIYVVTYFEEKQLNTGQIVEALSNWISKAKKVYTITTDSVCKYQNSKLVNKPSSVIRLLSNDDRTTFDYAHLESPNLVTGLGASVLTYCIHTRMTKCTLFVAYMDICPLDSLNSGGLLTLLEKLNVKVDRNIDLPKLLKLFRNSNLYM